MKQVVLNTLYAQHNGQRQDIAAIKGKDGTDGKTYYTWIKYKKYLWIQRLIMKNSLKGI